MLGRYKLVLCVVYLLRSFCKATPNTQSLRWNQRRNYAVTMSQYLLSFRASVYSSKRWELRCVCHQNTCHQSPSNLCIYLSIYSFTFSFCLFVYILCVDTRILMMMMSFSQVMGVSLVVTAQHPNHQASLIPLHRWNNPGV